MQSVRSGVPMCFKGVCLCVHVCVGGPHKSSDRAGRIYILGFGILGVWG